MKALHPRRLSLNVLKEHTFIFITFSKSTKKNFIQTYLKSNALRNKFSIDCFDLAIFWTFQTPKTDTASQTKTESVLGFYFRRLLKITWKTNFTKTYRKIPNILFTIVTTKPSVIFKHFCTLSHLTFIAVTILVNADKKFKCSNYFFD